MLEVTKQYRTETAHRLIKYEGRCAHIHGHSYLWEITATADNLNDKNMIVDFKDLKAVMVKVLDPFDHSFVMHRADPIAKLPNEVRDALLRPTFPSKTQIKGRVILFEGNPTAEAFAQHAAGSIQQGLNLHGGPEITITHVRVWETATCHADWYKPKQESEDAIDDTTG